jgi:hypothetical protein
MTKKMTKKQISSSLLVTFLALVFLLNVSAQSVVKIAPGRGPGRSHPTDEPNDDPVPLLPPIPYQDNESKGDPVGQSFVIGTTWYDMQHTGTIGKLISLTASRGVHLCWMNAYEAEAEHRHVYYNYSSPSGNIAWPDTGYRVDYYQRAGFTTLAHLSTGEAVVAYHSREVPDDPFHTKAAFDFLEGFGAFQVTPLGEPAGWYELTYPKVTVCGQDLIHIVSCELSSQPWNRIAYARSENGGYDYTPFVEVDTVMNIAHDVAASPVSNTVGIAYLRTAFGLDNLEPYEGTDVIEMNNDVFLVESEDGVTWDFSQKRNVTGLIEPDTSRYPDTTWANGDTLRAFWDVSLLYDCQDHAHLAFTTKGLWFDARLAAHPDSFAAVGMTRDASVIWHWSEATDSITVIARGWYDVGAPGSPPESYRGAGYTRGTVDRPSLGLDPETGSLYCVYVRCTQGDTSRGPIPSHGWANGEIYGTVSTDGGLNWSQGTNLTNKPSPKCWPNECFDDDYPSLAATVNDTLHLIYIEDKDAGAVVHWQPQEGAWTENPVKYQKVPAALVPPGPPFVSSFDFHVKPKPAPEPVSDLSITLSRDRLVLEWSPVTVDTAGGAVAVDRYHVFRDTAAFFGPGQTPFDSTVSTRYEDSTGATGSTERQYYYTVTAVSGIKESGYSNPVGEFDRELLSGEPLRTGKGR